MTASRVVEWSDFNALQEITDFVQRNESGESGGLLFFLGVVRGRSKEGTRVSRLEIEAEKDMATQELGRIAGEIASKFGLDDARIVHAVGTMRPGNQIVLVALAGKSREDVLPAMRESIHLYKTRALLFKKEVYDDGTGRWIEGD